MSKANKLQKLAIAKRAEFGDAHNERVAQNWHGAEGEAIRDRINSLLEKAAHLGHSSLILTNEKMGEDLDSLLEIYEATIIAWLKSPQNGFVVYRFGLEDLEITWHGVNLYGRRPL